MASPWERFRKEPEEAYARFLIYRGLGPLRSVVSAESVACGRKKKHASGNWTGEAAEWEWKRRATAWDISQLTLNGESLAFTFIGVIEKMAEQLAETVLGGKATPKSSRDVVEWLKALSPYLTPALIEKVRNRSVGSNDLPVDPGGADSSSE
jgi:hypothetical protein